MGKRLDYLAMAENDYHFLEQDYRDGRVGNIMCYASQSICERYLKHIIDTFLPEEDNTQVLKTHNLRNLLTWLSDKVPDFTCDKKTILACNGYYYAARYPGEDALEADAEDVELCWNAVEASRQATLDFLKLKQQPSVE